MNLDFTNLSTLLTIIGTLLTAIISCYVAIKKLISDKKKAKEKQAASILQLAKEQDNALKILLESRIKDIEVKVGVLRENVEKDLSHLKESYNSELKFLGQKLDELRKEVHDQHGQLVTLLTKLVGKD